MNSRIRAMRVLVYFDLPVETSEDRKNYTKFRKYLQVHGFVMVQKSVYCKLAVNSAAMMAIKKDVANHRPPKGNVQMLTVTERQFQQIDIIVGEAQKEILDTMDRFVVL